MDSAAKRFFGKPRISLGDCVQKARKISTLRLLQCPTRQMLGVAGTAYCSESRYFSFSDFLGLAGSHGWVRLADARSGLSGSDLPGVGSDFLPVGISNFTFVPSAFSWILIFDSALNGAGLSGQDPVDKASCSRCLRSLVKCSRYSCGWGFSTFTWTFCIFAALG